MSLIERLDHELIRADVVAGLFADDAVVRVDRYEVRARVGAGGGGAVYRAWDPVLERDVALKVLHEGVASSRARAEAEALARFSHPNIVRIFDVLSEDDELVLVMELVQGVAMPIWLLEAKPTRAEVLASFIAIGNGLGAVHDVGVVHRDFKPDNVLVGADGRVQLCDFGLAHGAPQLGSPEAVLMSGPSGTPAFMAPEQKRGSAGPASDQYAFCVSLGWALRQVGTDELGRIAAALDRGLSEQASERYPSMQALLEELAETDGHRHRSFAPWFLALGVLLLSVSVVVFASWQAKPEPCPIEALVLTPSAEGAALGPQVERYARRWDQARVAACERDAAPEALVCLQRHANRLVDAHHALEEERWAEAADAFDELREPDECLGRRSGGDVPGFARVEGTLVDAIAALRDESSLQIVDGGRERALELERVARRYGASRARIAALKLLAWDEAMTSNGDPDRHLEEAYAVAEGAALVRIASLGIRLSMFAVEPESGQGWFRQGRAQLARQTTVSVRDQVELLALGARLHVRTRRLEDAEAVLLQARQVAEARGGLDDTSRIELALAEADILSGQFRHSGAVAKLSVARELAEASGSVGFRYANVLERLAKELVLAGDLEAGVEAVEALLVTCPARRTTCTVLRASAELSLARALGRRGDVQEAQAAVERAKRELGGTGPRLGLEVLAKAAFLQAALLESELRLPEAHAAYARSIDLASGLSSAFLSHALCGRALAGLRLGRFASMLEDVKTAESLAADSDLCMLLARAHGEAGTGKSQAALRTVDRALAKIRPDSVPGFHGIILLAKFQAMRSQGVAASTLRGVLDEAERVTSGEGPFQTHVHERVEILRREL